VSAHVGALMATEAVDRDAVAALLDEGDRGLERLPNADAAALAAAGLLQDSRPSVLLSRALAARSSPVCTVELHRGDRVGHGWLDGEAALFVTPAADPRQANLTAVATGLVTDLLARMNGLGPRPRADPPVRITLAPGTLATALATRSIAGTGLGVPEDAALGQVLDTLRAHWSVEARWHPSPDSPGVRAVEVLDADCGLWLVVPDGPTVELWPTTPTQVFRLLAGLLPSDRELA